MSAVQPQGYTISDFKSRALNLSQTSLYQLNIVPPAVMQQPTENISLLCCDATLPGSSLATHDVTNDFHGVSEKMAYRRIYDQSFNMTFYVDREYNVISFFENWIEMIAGQGYTKSKNGYRELNSFYRMNYPILYRSSLNIVKFEKDHFYQNRSPLPPRKIGGPTLEYEIIGAFPYNIVAMPVSYGPSDILKCNVSFYFVRYLVNQARSRVISQVPTNTPSNNNNTVQFITKQVPVNKFDYQSNTLSNEYYNNFGDNKQNATNSADFFDGSNTGPFGLGVA